MAVEEPCLIKVSTTTKNEVRLTQDQRLSWTIFLGLGLLYLSLSPLSVVIMGYMPEFVTSAHQTLGNIGHFFGLYSSYTSIDLPRHGMVEVIFELPFVAIGQIFGGGWVDHLVSLEPIAMTAGICAIVFVWTRQLTESLKWAYLLTIAAAFTTMLWPYAYIALETTQSFFLLLSGYLALGSSNRFPRRTAAFAICAAIAVSAKATGVFLVPAIALLMLWYCRLVPDQSSARAAWLRQFDWRRLAFVGAVVLAVFSGNHYLQMHSPVFVQLGGASGMMAKSITSPTSIALNIFYLFTSANKGLFMYNPVLLVAFFALPSAWKNDRWIVVFALLVLGGIVAGISPTFFWSDEIWGPRYLHSAIAPLLICLALSKRGIVFVWRRLVPIGLCMAAGLAISFLGIFFWCHLAHDAAVRSEWVTLEQLQHAPEWNPIRFNAQLLRLWFKNDVLRQNIDQFWPPQGHPWVWVVPRNEWPPISRPVPVNLRRYATPQPFLFSSWRRWRTRSDVICWSVCLAALLVGFGILFACGVAIFRSKASPIQGCGGGSQDEVCQRTPCHETTEPDPIGL